MSGNVRDAGEVLARRLQMRHQMVEWRKKKPNGKKVDMWESVAKIESQMTTRGVNPTPGALRV
jgi:hypothetical protein